MGVIQKHYSSKRFTFTDLILSGDVKKVVICTSNIEKEPFLSQRKLPLTIGNEYNVYMISHRGNNHPEPREIYLVIPDDKFEKTPLLRFIRKIFFIKKPYPIHVSAKHFKDADVQYLRNKTLEQLLD